MLDVQSHLGLKYMNLKTTFFTSQNHNFLQTFILNPNSIFKFLHFINEGVTDSIKLQHNFKVLTNKKCYCNFSFVHTVIFHSFLTTSGIARGASGGTCPGVYQPTFCSRL